MLDRLLSFTRFGRRTMMLAVAGSLLVIAAVALAFAEANSDDNRPDGRGRGTILFSPHGRGDLKGNHDKGPAAKPTSGNGIYYHGGPVMTGNPVNIYYIWYGNWGSLTIPNWDSVYCNSSSGTQNILNNLAFHIAPTSYFNIETTYYQLSNTGLKTSATNHVTLGGCTSVTTYNPTSSHPYSTSLSDNDILAIVTTAITGNHLPADPNGVYFVLTSADVSETSGFCSHYCAWHWSTSANGTANVNNVDIKYGFIGNPARCPSACETQINSSPNNNPAADSMADGIAHELEETVNDPDANAWYDHAGNESADKCAWTYGTTKTAPNDSAYNITLGSLNYLLQRNWVNANGGYCSMSY
jgi:hypothetical protein